MRQKKFANKYERLCRKTSQSILYKLKKINKIEKTEQDMDIISIGVVEFG